MAKRALDDSDDYDHETPEASGSSLSKRRHLDVLSTPARPPRTSSSCSLYSTPYTPYSYSIPSDSPSNPFGFNRRSVKLVLPRESSFSRHLALRFQLVDAPDLPPIRKRPRGRMIRDKNGRIVNWDQEGTYRIVQVPLNYTFRHLHALIIFLFDGDPTHAREPPPPTKSEPGYLFEVLCDVTFFPDRLQQPGHIRSGSTFAKASRMQDPYYSSQSILDLVEKAESDTAEELPFFEGEDWTWENEDDYALSNVWPPGGDLDRAIIYRHDAKRVIHITVCTQTIPPRKGVGNKPFVFRAYETVHLDPKSPAPGSIFPPSPFKKPALPIHSLPTPSPTDSSVSPVKPSPVPTSDGPAASASSSKQRRLSPTLESIDPFSNPFKKVVKASASTATVSTSSAQSIFSKRHKAEPAPPSPVEPVADSDADAAGSSDEEEAPFDGGLDPKAWNRHDAFSRFLARFAGPPPIEPGKPIPTNTSESALDDEVDGDSPLRIPGSSRSSSFSDACSVWEGSSPLRLPLVTPAPADTLTRIRNERALRKLRQLTEDNLKETEREALEQERRAQRAKERKEARVREEERRKAAEKLKEERARRVQTARTCRRVTKPKENDETEAGYEDGDGPGEHPGAVVAVDWNPFDCEGTQFGYFGSEPEPDPDFVDSDEV
ncbi:hypothetical protein K488DRAFT_86657 [Vararia minispora EC-137]|uniref:Uncharacterized protein n=1 Tax=Vararia minispora EC-137 TaxID=1314806 RepID=A0ACB8QIE9_9AGAM|nr:hypothetical protein K488DRAFT_86657 [Vararia minispora EC-137]